MSGSNASGKWEKILRITAESIAVLSIAAFALSCLMNAFVFSRWNHDFLQLATPSDVITSGLRLLGSLSIPISIACFTSFLFFIYIINADGLSNRVKRIPINWVISRNIAGFIEKSLLVLFVLLCLGMFLYGIWGAWAGYFLLDTIDICIGTFLSTFGTIGFIGHFFLNKGFGSNQPAEILFSFLVIISLVFGYFLVWSWLADRVDDQATSGFHPQQLSVFRQGRDICGGGSLLLWSGSQSSLIECPSSGGERLILVLRDAENVDYLPTRFILNWPERFVVGSAK